MNDDTAFSELEFQLANLVRQLEAITRRRRYPLERAHYLVLVHLRQGPLTVRELAEKLALDNSTVTRQLNAMEARGLIEKQPNPDDGRSALVTAVRSGHDLAQEMQCLRIQRIRHMLRDWEHHDIDDLTRLTGRLTDALTRSLETPDIDAISERSLPQGSDI